MPPVQDPQTDSLHRVRWFARIAVLWAAIIVIRLIQLQLFQHWDYLRQAQSQQEKQIEIQASRGSIYDRNGQALAMSLPVDSVCVNPMRVPDAQFAADMLARTLDLEATPLYYKIRLAQEAKRGFLWIKRKITPQESERLRSYGFDWVEYRQESRRFYPKGQLAAHVVGSVDHEERGNAGLELGLNDELEGHPGVMKLLTDVKQRGFDSQMFTEPQPGKNLTLTIDERIQHVAETALAQAVTENSCKTGSLVVMEPNSGDILALANYPTFDPNETLKPGASLADRDNLSVSVPFEPGSVFKVITLAAALETTNLRPESIINCGNGVIRLAGRVIHDHDPYSALSMADVLAKSSNIGAIQVGLRVGPEKLLEYVKRFGFGVSTGLPLPAESSGVVRPLTQWGASSIGSVAMGHEISTSTVQLGQACSVIANGGYLVKPRIVKARQRPGGSLESEPKSPMHRQVLQPDNVTTMRTMMEGVVLRGTGKKARLDGYSAAGKTGSAQIFDLQTHQYTHKYNASFMGFAPVQNPAVVVVVTLNGASKYGGAVAAPVFQQVASAALRVLNVHKDVPDGLPAEDQDDTPVDDLAIPDLGASSSVLAESAGGRPGTLSTPVVLAQGPAFGPQPATLAVTGPQVPNFAGKSVRGVLEEAARTGVPVEYTGSGTARAQWPAPGAILPPGERIRVQFAR